MKRTQPDRIGPADPFGPATKERTRHLSLDAGPVRFAGGPVEMSEADPLTIEASRTSTGRRREPHEKWCRWARARPSRSRQVGSLARPAGNPPSHRGCDAVRSAVDQFSKLLSINHLPPCFGVRTQRAAREANGPAVIPAEVALCGA
jgi:hypothetical protein